jgi:hypothetical protein
MAKPKELDANTMLAVVRLLLVRWYPDKIPNDDAHNPLLLREKFMKQLEQGVQPELQGNLVFGYHLLHATSRDEAYSFAERLVEGVGDAYSFDGDYIVEYALGINDIFILDKYKIDDFCAFCKNEKQKNHRDNDSNYFLNFLIGEPANLSLQNVLQLIKKKEDMTIYK